MLIFYLSKIIYILFRRFLMMKKLIMTLFTATLFLSFAVTSFAADSTTGITRSDATLKVIQALYNGAYNNEKTFTIDDYYCIHASGSTHFVPDYTLKIEGYPVLCTLYQNVSELGFSDIKEPENAISLAKAMGIVKGFPNGTFHPQEALTYNEAYAILTSAFYLPKVHSTLIYPNDFINSAKNAGFFDASTQGDEKIPATAFEKMLNTCLQETKNSIQNTLFTPAFTADECVSYYANAVKNRNGMLQYALLHERLKERYSMDFENTNWVTGLSSSQIESFSINKIDPLNYEIHFNWAPSTTPASTPPLRVTLEAVSLGDVTVYLITTLENL